MASANHRLRALFLLGLVVISVLVAPAVARDRPDDKGDRHDDHHEEREDKGDKKNNVDACAIGPSYWCIGQKVSKIFYLVEHGMPQWDGMWHPQRRLSDQSASEECIAYLEPADSLHTVSATNLLHCMLED